MGDDAAVVICPVPDTVKLIVPDKLEQVPHDESAPLTDSPPAAESTTLPPEAVPPTSI